MPKRQKTPPLPDDFKYLTVVYPYPAFANMELPEDRKTFARWIACITGVEALVAFYYKPTSPNAVIIEVLKSFSRWDDLLGLHDWERVLKNPGVDEKGRVSKVFYCTWSEGRGIQKRGWKRIDIKNAWYQGWDAVNNDRIVHPYPATEYCEAVQADVTGEPLCRPLPVKSFPPPKSDPAPPVGTPEWQQWKQRQDILKAEKEAIRAQLKRDEKLRSNPPPAPAVKPPSSIQAPVPVKATAPVRVAGAWSRGPPPLNPPSLASPHSLPPDLLTGLTVRTVSRQSNKVASPTSDTASSADWPITPTLTRGPSGESEREVAPAPAATTDLANAYEQPDAGDEDVYVDEPLAKVSWVPSPVGSCAPLPEEPVESLWDQYEDDEVKPGVILCEIHNMVCKSMCRQYSAQLKALEREQRDKARKKEGNDGRWPRGKRPSDDKFKLREDGVGSKGNARASIVKPPPRPLPASLAKPVTSGTSFASATSASSPPTTSPVTPAVKTPTTPATPAAPLANGPPTGRVARGRKMNAANAGSAAGTPGVSAASLGSASTFSASSTSGSKNHPWGDTDKVRGLAAGKSAASADKLQSSGGAWADDISEGPWKTAQSTNNQKKGAWADDISEGPWKTAQSTNNQKKIKKGPASVVSSTGGWGAVAKAKTPWDASSRGAPSVVGDDSNVSNAKGKNKEFDPFADDEPLGSWDDEMAKMDDTRSVAASSHGGWGRISNGPWDT
ncbi:hypothetical protein K474DRAFT_1664954 [Panus rudis PR-1116 ss-1]|nr:hypothetical protein K474DRAFT_1664954 [Panus rudis PR-1116 ss-1]